MYRSFKLLSYSLFIICANSKLGFTQEILSEANFDTIKEYKSLDEAMKNPRGVYKLDLHIENGRKGGVIKPNSVTTSVKNGDLEKLPNLHELNLANNGLLYLPPDILKLKYLKRLDLSLNNFGKSVKSIGTIPKEITNLTTIERLDLSFCNLERLPVEIGDMISLKELIMVGNDFKYFPSEMAKLKHLKKINLKMSWSTIPSDEIQKLRTLLPNTEIEID